MTPDDFVRALETSCSDGAVDDCVSSFIKPSGRKPRQSLAQLSQWFTSLSASEREFVVRAMGEAADATLFGVLCVIDGVRSVEPIGEKSEFKLTATRDGVESIISPNDTFLHDILRAKP
jgi:hypothetical protein